MSTKTSSIYLTESKKYPIIITIGFFLTFSYIAFFQHTFWFENDGIYFLKVGEEFLNGNGWNVKLFDAPPGGPIFFASINSLFDDGFFTLKIISVLSGTGIVFFSFYVVRNIFSYKIAILSQLLIAFNPRLDFASISALNELFSVFFIFVSLYFITKKHLKLFDFIIVGTTLGISFMFRYQPMLVLIAIVIFLLIHNRKLKLNLFHISIVISFFLIVLSPMLFYNFVTFGSFLDTDANLYLLFTTKFQTSEWHYNMEQLVVSGTDTSGLFNDFDLFLKNYFYNLFYHNSDIIFNFDKLDNLSITPPIPFLGIIPVLGGFLYSFNIKSIKNTSILLAITAGITSLFVFLLGDFSLHFFAIIILPIFVLGLINITKIKSNLLPLVILSVVYLLVISISPLYRSYQLFPMWIIIPMMSSIFFLEVIPKIISKISRNEENES